jgi:CRP/FNR family transcriptional regulator
MGEASFLISTAVSSAAAITRCEIVPVDRQAARQIFPDHPDLPCMLKYQARTIRLLSGHVDDISFQGAHKRIARLLLSLSEDGQGTIVCRQDEIGFAVGASRVTVSRYLGIFAERLAENRVSDLELTDLSALRNFANAEHAAGTIHSSRGMFSLMFDLVRSCSQFVVYVCTSSLSSACR